MCDGNAAITPAGSTTLNLTKVGSALWAGLIATFKPYVAPTTDIKTINGLAIASVKTINGLAIASVKTWNGLA